MIEAFGLCWNETSIYIYIIPEKYGNKSRIWNPQSKLLTLMVELHTLFFVMGHFPVKI